MQEMPAVNQYQKPGDMPKIVGFILSTVNVVLAANLTSVLGVKAIRIIDTKIPTRNLLASWWYVFMLVAVFCLWSQVSFSEDPEVIVSALPTIGKVGVGILVAMLVSALGAESILWVGVYKRTFSA